MALPKVVSLFSGAGGLDLGFHQSGYEIALAVDSSKWALSTHRRNFPASETLTADLSELGAAGLLKHLEKLLTPGEAVCVVGGPPCQGFSRANSNSRADDPRNLLPGVYLDMVEALQGVYSVEFVLLENVLGIRDAKHKPVFDRVLSRLKGLGFAVRVSEYYALDFAVAQTRRRVFVAGFADKRALGRFAPAKISTSAPLTVRSKIGDLPEPAFFTPMLDRDDIPHHPNHWTMQPRSLRFSQPSSEVISARSFRQLDWDKPSPTVAYGHREIHVHPLGHRRLSIYEAMLLQGFPSEFVLDGPLSAQVEQVSNAVPPPVALALARAAAEAMLPSDREEVTQSNA